MSGGELMNIRHLEIIEAVEQTGTFTGAAKKLHLTQSAVSHAIAELEQQAGTALFDRLPRGVCLTSCGTMLLKEARS
ncbi:LysR family transcriptional regulator, partial [Romboutsia ilealis]|nr:LysR family transcriptional regulator [Romboutsia ilealis]